MNVRHGELGPVTYCLRVVHSATKIGPRMQKYRKFIARDMLLWRREVLSSQNDIGEFDLEGHNG